MARSLRRILTALVGCAGAAPMCAAQTTVSLNATDTCLNASETTLTVRIDMTAATDIAVGGQFFLQYDNSALTLLTAQGAGPFATAPIFLQTTANTIDLAVGVPLGGPGTAADSTLAVLTFAVTADACDVGDLVFFRAHTPPTRVTNAMGIDHLATANDLGVIRIDSVLPVLTVTSGLVATDNCADAMTLPGVGTFQYSTTAASFSAPDGGGTCDDFGPGTSPDVWYMYVPPATGVLTVNTCGLTDYDTVLEALTECGSATVACNDDSCGLESSISLPVLSQVPVMIRMAGYSGSTGSGYLSVNFTPAAANGCGDAATVGEGTFPYDLAGATNDFAGTCGTSGAAQDRWFRYVPSVSGPVTIATCGLTTGDSVLEILDECGGPVVTCNDDSCSFQSNVLFAGIAGEDYYVRIADFNGGFHAGAINITVPGGGNNNPPAFTLDRVVKADAGFCDAVVNYGATATDTCDAAPMITYSPAAGIFPIGTTPVTVTATDACGNSVSTNFTVTVLAVNEMIADVELANVDPGVFSRCIRFDLYDTFFCNLFTTHDQTMWFTNGVTRTVVDVPCGFYDCATARDRLHTLRRTDDDGDFTTIGTRYVTDFTAAGTTDDSLVGGNLNDDQFIEILDFGVFVGQYSVNFGTPNTNCATPPFHADISGNGLVDVFDFSFIQINFLDAREVDCCLQASHEGPRDTISTIELEKLGHADLIVADLNQDGWVNTSDIVAFMNGARPCAADWNRDARVNTNDFYAFLNAFFAGDADYTRDGQTDTEDFFSFLTTYLSGC